jgi:xanthine dehydrogenase YagS FAD-binding subunit
MRPFEYARPGSLAEAVRLLGEAGAGGAVLGGGTDLLSLMKDEVVAPTRLVSLTDVPELRGIRRDRDGTVRIGAATRLEELARDPTIRNDVPALVEAIEGIRSAQILSMATVGGNLCQRPHCWYFRNGLGLLARHEGRPLVLEGDDRHHAILGNEGPAYFTSPSSLAVVFVSLGATARIVGSRGERAVPLERFYRIPRSETEREHDLAAGELLAWVELRVVAGRRSAFREVRQREGLDWPLASAAVAFELEEGRISRARLVLGHVAPIPWYSEEGSRALLGSVPSEESARSAAAAAVSRARPLRRNRYKVVLAETVARRAIVAAAGLESEP